MASSKSAAKNPAYAALRAIAKTIASLSDEELTALAQGRATLKLERSAYSSRQVEMALEKRDAQKFNYSKLRDELREVESTEMGFNIISEAQLSRSELEQTARSLDLPVMKQDSTRRLEEKIVEALIGSRLNSRAVRGR